MYEKAGDLDLEMPFAVKPVTARLALTKTGTSNAINGTVVLAGQQGLEVWVTCTGAREIRREAKTDAHGDFEVKDVGALPCTIESFTSNGSTQIHAGLLIRVTDQGVRGSRHADADGHDSAPLNA